MYYLVPYLPSRLTDYYIGRKLLKDVMTDDRAHAYEHYERYTSALLSYYVLTGFSCKEDWQHRDLFCRRWLDFACGLFSSSQSNNVDNRLLRSQNAFHCRQLTSLYRAELTHSSNRKLSSPMITFNFFCLQLCFFSWSGGVLFLMHRCSDELIRKSLFILSVYCLVDSSLRTSASEWQRKTAYL